MESNPYASPSANLFGSTSGTSADIAPPGAIVQLQRTKPWVRFIGVLLWIMIALMAAVLAFGAVAGAAGLSALAQSQGGAEGMPAAAQGVAAVSMLVGFGIMLILYVYPAIKLWKYGTFIGKLVISRSAADLESALDQQRALWKFAGILTIISLCIYAVVIVLAIAGAAMGGLPTTP